MDSYEQKLQVVKENYFPKEVVSEDKLEDTFEATNEVTNTVMSKYAQAISKTTKHVKIPEYNEDLANYLLETILF